MKYLRKLEFLERETRGFGSWVKACRHICDHMLSLPEALAWSVFVPWLKPIIESRAGFEMAKRIWTERGDEDFQRLYDAYLAEIQTALDSGGSEGWHGGEAQDNSVNVLGINGVLTVLVEDTVVTAFFPGHGEAQTTAQACKPAVDEEEIPLRKINPLPRSKSSENDSERLAFEGDEKRQKAKIFKKSAKSVRKREASWYSKEVVELPRLSFEAWSALYDKYAPPRNGGAA